MSTNKESSKKCETLSIDDIIKEIVHGEWDTNTPETTCIPWCNECEAMYFSNVRRYLQSDMADLIINTGQQLDELVILKNAHIIPESNITQLDLFEVISKS